MTSRQPKPFRPAQRMISSSDVPLIARLPKPSLTVPTHAFCSGRPAARPASRRRVEKTCIMSIAFQPLSESRTGLPSRVVEGGAGGAQRVGRTFAEQPRVLLCETAEVLELV